jgi:hypothetical protein
MTVKKYRIYCNTDSKFVTGWSDTEPTTCYDNNTHTIDVNQTSVVDFDVSKIEIIQTEPERSNYFYLQSIHTDIEANTTMEIPVSIDIDFYIFGVHINLTRESIGDIISVHINKDTVIGTATADSTGSVITVSQTVIDNSVVGFYVLFNSDYYRIIDKSATTITVKGSPVVTNGEPIYITYFMVYKKAISNTFDNLGFAVLAGKKILKTDVASITYENNYPIRKTFNIDIEMLF